MGWDMGPVSAVTHHKSKGTVASRILAVIGRDVCGHALRVTFTPHTITGNLYEIMQLTKHGGVKRPKQRTYVLGPCECSWLAD